MSTLDEKRAKLQKSGFGIMEKRMLRQVLGSLGSVSLNLRCNVTSCIVMVKPDPDGNTRVEVRNSENGNYVDITHTAAEMEDEYPPFADMVKDIMKTLEDCAEFWNTKADNIHFKAWTDQAGKKVRASISPIEGFPDSEELVMA